MSESQKESYDRGVLAGEVAARLAGHDKHFSAINGSLEKISHTLEQFLTKQNLMIVELQRLSDSTSGLKEAEHAKQKTQIALAASPWLTALVLIAIVGVLVGVISGMVALVR